MIYLVIFGAAFAVSALLTPLVGRLSMRWGILAQPGGRRLHQGFIPKLGGLPIFGGLLTATILIYWLIPPAGDDVGLLRGVILGTLVVFIGGLADDYFDLPPWGQFLIHFTGTAVAMGFAVFIERFTNPLPSDSFWVSRFPALFFTYQEPPTVVVLPWFVWVITLFWIVGMLNTINFLDGLDGLAGGVGAIAALIFAWHSYQLEQYAVAAFPLALAGALLGFLPFNFSPARIFLGSAGAYLLGYQLATLSIISPAKIATALLVMAVPILDVAWQIVTRLRRRQSPLRGDRGHLHFRLSDGGLPTRRIVFGYYLVALSFGLVAIFAPSPLVKLGLMLVLATAVLVLLNKLTNNAK